VDRVTAWTAGAIKVGDNHYYWAVYRLIPWFDAIAAADHEPPERTPEWLPGEGFAPTLAEALKAAYKLGRRLPEPKRVRHGDGDQYIRQIYKDYYGSRLPFLDFPLLGISRNATRAEIMTAFRTLAKTAHPDAGGDAAAFRALVAEKDRALGMIG
jgi:hypothetical protein